MKENALFEPLQTEVLALESSYKPFWSAYLDALKGGNDRRDLREGLRIPMVKQMNKLGHLVEAFAEGNTSIASASGYELKKRTNRRSKT